MVKDGVNRLGRVGPLVTRAVIASGIVKIIAINHLFIGLNYLVFTFQYDSTHGKFNGPLSPTCQIETQRRIFEGMPEHTGNRGIHLERQDSNADSAGSFLRDAD